MSYHINLLEPSGPVLACSGIDLPLCFQKGDKGHGEIYCQPSFHYLPIYEKEDWQWVFRSSSYTVLTSDQEYKITWN